MTGPKEISHWLSLPEQERDYIKGIELYQQYGDNPRLKRLVFTAANNFPGNKKSLEHELTKLAVRDVVKKIDNYNAEKAASGRSLAERAVIVGFAESKKILSDFDKSEPDQPETRRVETPQQSLRKEFPQLNFADLTPELKILLVDKGILFNKAKEAKKQLDAATTDADRFKWNKIMVDAMLENQQIWDELNHFQSHKKILGKHPMFSRKKDMDKLKVMNNASLIKLKSNIPTYVSKAKTAMKDNPKDEKLLKRKRALLDKYAWMEKEVDRLLDI